MLFVFTVKALKAVVPSPLLKSCLDTMSISAANDAKGGNEDSDDDDFVKVKKKGSKDSAKNDKFTGSLLRKVGRNANTTLYYINPSQLPNEGNGMTPDDRNELTASLQKCQEDLKVNAQSIQTINANSTQLQSEPLNEEIQKLLPTEESSVQDLSNQVTEANKLKVNASRRKVVDKKIEKMATFWRKRKRSCVDFLSMMEDCTEGTVSAKKCLAGSGQIELESDEAIVKQAKEMYANRKNNKRHKMRPVGKASKTNGGSDVQPSESFIAVTLGPNGIVQRVCVGE
jgi:hypothetical protein